ANVRTDDVCRPGPLLPAVRPGFPAKPAHDRRRQRHHCRRVVHLASRTTTQAEPAFFNAAPVVRACQGSGQMRKSLSMLLVALMAGSTAGLSSAWAATSDFDGDGVSDLVWRNGETGHN